MVKRNTLRSPFRLGTAPGTISEQAPKLSELELINAHHFKAVPDKPIVVFYPHILLSLTFPNNPLREFVASCSEGVEIAIHEFSGPVAPVINSNWAGLECRLFSVEQEWWPMLVAFLDSISLVAAIEGTGRLCIDDLQVRDPWALQADSLATTERIMITTKAIGVVFPSISYKLSLESGSDIPRVVAAYEKP